MPQGYYTIEQWKRPKWVAVAVLPFGLTQTGAEDASDRYAVGTGLGLLVLHEDLKSREKASKKPVDPEQVAVAKQAAASAAAGSCAGAD